MYSDSRDVIDAIAEFIEASCQGAGREALSEGRMNQVRHIIQVDESAFQANFSAEQLETIETKEMAAIVEELAFAIGLQRVRFSDRQAKGKIFARPLCLRAKLGILYSPTVCS
jgi:hypothetical protein